MVRGAKAHLSPKKSWPLQRPGKFKGGKMPWEERAGRGTRKIRQYGLPSGSPEIVSSLKVGLVPDVETIEPKTGQPLDMNIVPLLQSLNKEGFETTGSCGGHTRGEKFSAPYVVLDLDASKRRELREKLSPLADSLAIEGPGFKTIGGETVIDPWTTVEMKGKTHAENQILIKHTKELIEKTTGGGKIDISRIPAKRRFIYEWQGKADKVKRRLQKYADRITGSLGEDRVVIKTTSQFHPPFGKKGMPPFGFYTQDGSITMSVGDDPRVTPQHLHVLRHELAHALRKCQVSDEIEEERRAWKVATKTQPESDDSSLRSEKWIARFAIGEHLKELRSEKPSTYIGRDEK